jgi:acetyl esterase
MPLHPQAQSFLALVANAPPLDITAECDPLRDDGESYAQALRSARVPVEYRCFEGQVHPFVMMGGIIDAAHEARRLVGERLRQSFGG